MNVFENFAPKSKKRSLFLIDEEEDDIKNSGGKEGETEDVTISGFPFTLATAKSSDKPSLKARLSGFLSQIAPILKPVNDNLVVPATPRFQRANIKLENLSNWLGENDPLWSGLTINTNLPVNYFNEISDQISAAKNASSLFKFSPHTFQQTSSPTLSDILQTSREDKLTSDHYRFQITQPSQQAIYQSFYAQYEEALNDCLDQLLLPPCSTAPRKFILLYESRLKTSSSTPTSLTVGGGKGANNVVLLNQLKKNEKESFFTFCVYDRYPSSSSSGSKENDVRCIITNLKTAIFRKLIGFPDFQYLLLAEDETSDDKDQSNSNNPRKKAKKNDTTSLSASGEYKQKLQGRSIVIIGEYSVKIWNYVILEAIYQKLFSFSWQTNMMSSFSSFDINREKLTIFIPTIVNIESFSHALREKLSLQLLGSTRSKRAEDNQDNAKDRSQEYQWKVNGLLSVNMVKEVLFFLQEKSKNHSDHSSNKMRFQQLLASLPPPLTSKVLKTRKVEEDEKENKLKEEMLMKHRKSRSNVKLVNPFTFEAVKTPASSSSLVEESSNHTVVDKEQDEAMDSNEFFVTIKPEPSESKLHYLSSSLIKSTLELSTSGDCPVKLVKEMKWRCNETDASMLIVYEMKPSFTTRNDDQQAVEELTADEKEKEDLY